MKNLIAKLGSIFVPIILCIALILTASMSADSIDDLQGNARVINYIGIVRGATQRLVKEELNHIPDNDLIERLDNILSGLSNGSEEFDLVKLESPKFQSLLKEMKRQWADIKEAIVKYRNGSPDQNLYVMSEEYFELADEAVHTAETYTEQIVQDTRNLMIFINTVFIAMAICCTVFLFFQEKRRNKLIKIENENKQKSEELSKRFQELLIPMNEISELMYVSDIETYDLLFINEAGKKTFQLDGDNLEGKKCYKVLQGFDSPCSFCTNPLLNMDETYSWEYTNPLTKKHYLLKDHLMEWEGRPARMEIAFDITKTTNEKIELKKRLERDNILVDCIRELYRNHDFMQAAKNVLEQIGKLFLAERSYIFLFHGDSFSNIAEWCKTGITPQIDHLQNLPKSEYSIWFDMFEKQDSIVIDDVQKLKDTMPSGYILLDQQGIKNIVWVPLEKDGQLNGCVGLDNLAEGLTNTAIPFLQTIQYFITLAMQRDEDEKELYKLSFQDKLTSFYNRNRYIQDITDLQSYKKPVGVVYLDVNGLKEINDHFGHDAGDKLLQNCANIIKSSFTAGNLYRIGGDEFVIICTAVDKEAFFDTVQKLKNNFLDSGCKVAIGCEWEESSTNIHNIIKNADQLMYKDKKKFYQNHKATNRYRHGDELLQFLADPDILRNKIDNNNFKVYLQAKMDVEKRKIVGAEALVRYQDENGLIRSPDKFIHILETSNFISKIDYYVFEEVCKNLLNWKNKRMELFTVSSNFSRNTFMDDDFLKRIESISDKYDIDRNLLEIEITESTSSVDFDALKYRIDEIRKAGYRISVDDFGIESSNLALLSVTEFDVLKIDKGFVKNIILNENSRMIIQMMADICRKMNIQLVAEGVETNEQLDILKTCGVEIVQGFLFSRPKPIDEYGSILTLYIIP